MWQGLRILPIAIVEKEGYFQAVLGKDRCQIVVYYCGGDLRIEIMKTNRCFDLIFLLKPVIISTIRKQCYKE